VVPAGAAALLVIHENRALTPYIQDVVRRWAKAGYVALCVDMLSRLGGSAAYPDESLRPAALGTITTEQSLADLLAGLDYLKVQSNVKADRLGVTGFCFGGGYTWRVATQRADVKATVAFYGPNPPLTDIPKIKSATLGFYGALDTRITGAVGELETALKMASITYQLKIYDGADHAFHNDTGTRYQPDAAHDAWQRAVDWFAKYV
jgi:carboxymethylenebutenolidase